LTTGNTADTLATRILRPDALPAVLGGPIMRFILALIATSVFAISPAIAQDSGFYVGAGIGDFSVDVGSFSGSDTGFKLFGGYKFIKYLAAEVEYIDGGTVDDSGFEIDVSGWNLSGVGILPVGEKFNVFAKLGMIFWDADLGGMESASDSGEDFSWGIGAGYSFTEQFGMQLEYQGFEIEDTDTVDMISLGASWKF
jgi:OOP family OmpA-OmpF porin